MGLRVKDAGMRVVLALAPDVRWQSGGADVSLHVAGPNGAHNMQGRAAFTRAALSCPWLKFPVTNLSGSLHVADKAIQVRAYTIYQTILPHWVVAYPNGLHTYMATCPINLFGFASAYSKKPLCMTVWPTSHLCHNCLFSLSLHLSCGAWRASIIWQPRIAQFSNALIKVYPLA